VLDPELVVGIHEVDGTDRDRPKSLVAASARRSGGSRRAMTSPTPPT
jgi:hypothetical protein